MPEIGFVRPALSESPNNAEAIVGKNTNPYWHPDIKPHVIDLADIERLCLECLHIMLASSRAVLLDLDEDGISNGASRLRNLHLNNAEKMLSKSLLQIAVSVRTFDDRHMQMDDKQYIAHLKTIDAEGPFAISYGEDAADLGIRETCNKIIHAQDFRPVYERDDDQGEATIWFMDTSIELEGERNGKQWAFTLSTISFLDCVLDLLAFQPA